MTQLKSILFHEVFPNLRTTPPQPPLSHKALSLPCSAHHSIKFKQWHVVIAFSLVCLLTLILIAFQVQSSSYLWFLTSSTMPYTWVLNKCMTYRPTDASHY